MSIYGIGIDVIRISRIKKIITSKKQISRIFNKNEILKCKKKKSNVYSCFAKKFAAKEAFSKALGIGISKGLHFNEIDVSNNDNGTPLIKINKGSLKTVKLILKKKYKINLSITDEKDYAIAIVTITK